MPFLHWVIALPIIYEGNLSLAYNFQSLLLLLFSCFNLMYRLRYADANQPQQNRKNNLFIIHFQKLYSSLHGQPNRK